MRNGHADEIGNRIGLGRYDGGHQQRRGRERDAQPASPRGAHARYSAAMCASRCTSVLMSCSGDEVSSSMPQPRTHS